MPPTYGALLAMLPMAEVTFTKLLKFRIPVYLILFAISLIVIVVVIHRGLQ